MRRIRDRTTGLLPRWRTLVLLAAAVAATAVAETAGDRRLLVDTRALTLSVIDGTGPQMTLHNVSIGRNGASAAKRRGDNTTPLGLFRITRIQRDAAFHRFIGISYPDPVRAEEGFRQGLISEDQWRRIARAHRRGEVPPADTALGGHIGIHGLGRGDPDLHEAVNWTRGCVALTDEQIDSLVPWVRTGMAVEIR